MGLNALVLFLKKAICTEKKVKKADQTGILAVLSLIWALKTSHVGWNKIGIVPQNMTSRTKFELRSLVFTNM